MKKLLFPMMALMLSGCLFAPPPRHRPPEPEHQPGPGPEPKVEEPTPPPPNEPEVPEHTTPPADPPQDPPPDPGPQLTIRAVPANAKAGQMVELHLDPPVGKDVKVFWNAQMIMKETHADGAMLKVRVPGDAKGAGVFKVEWQGKHFESPAITLAQ